MGRTYYHVGARKVEFDMNFAGADLVGLLHRRFGAYARVWTDALPDPEAFKREHPEAYDIFSKKVDLPGRFSRAQAVESADRLDAATDDALAVFVREHASLWGGDEREFVEHAREWAKFLRDAKRGVDCY